MLMELRRPLFLDQTLLKLECFAETPQLRDLRHVQHFRIRRETVSCRDLSISEVAEPIRLGPLLRRTLREKTFDPTSFGNVGSNVLGPETDQEALQLPQQK